VRNDIARIEPFYEAGKGSAGRAKIENAGVARQPATLLSKSLRLLYAQVEELEAVDTASDSTYHGLYFTAADRLDDYTIPDSQRCIDGR
jgi:hypothetical protein